MAVSTERSRAARIEGISNKPSINSILAESETEVGRYAWRGTFADYLQMVTENPALNRLAHSLVYDAILAAGVDSTTDGEPVYRLFEDEIFGLENDLERIVQYFAAAAQGLEVRKRILLLLGPPASGKSSVVDLIKRALERHTRTDAGAVYTIQGCPMQEEPLHLIPERLRPELQERHGLYVEGEPCPRCRYVLRTVYGGKISEMPVERVTLDEKEAVGIGYYLASNPNPTDASLLVGSVNESMLDGDRLEVAAKAFRLDGELNIANRGLMEFVEMFKADRHMLTTLLGLAQEQLIKNQKFGSVYADEVIIGHSNEGDFESFAGEVSSEALRDRIIAVQVPYNLRVREEVKIYQKMMRAGKLPGVHIAPQTLRVASIFATLTRLEPTDRQGMSLMQKLRLYDGQTVPPYTKQDLHEVQRHHPNEGMSGISPRYVMNRLDAIASRQDVRCATPLAALDSLWEGLGENISLDQSNKTRFIGFVSDAVKEYGELAIKDIKMAFEDSFEERAAELLKGYLANVAIFCRNEPTTRDMETEMKQFERTVGVTDRNKAEFRREINQTVSAWEERGRRFTYTSEARIQHAVEESLLLSDGKIGRGLTQPRFPRQRVEWSQRLTSIAIRLQESYGYCEVCAEDVVKFAEHALKNRPFLKTPKNESVEWLWPLNPGADSPDPDGI